jgi:hypothetical protein
VELTKEFMRRLPFVWPTINIRTPFGGTLLYERCLTEGRSAALPDYYRRVYERKLGEYAGLLSQAERTPVLETS